ncbi:MAG: hypothetical protein JXM68_07380 [Sedimentisphaerales bacterium]|nr:hypothetical protein [Sedimentisphaerales bacterium]
MNSDQRHKLNSNELEGVIEEMPAMLRHHWIGIVVVVTLVIVSLVSWTGLKYTIKKNTIESQQALSTILASRSSAQVATLNGGANYNSAAEVSALSSYSEKNAGKPAGYNAMIQQASTILSELYFGNEYLTAEKKAEICGQAAAIYEAVASKYSQNSSAICLSQLGLAAIAAELGQWDKAQSLYDGILANKEALASTAFPAMAQTGLAKLAELKKIEAIEFVPAPKPEPSEEAATPVVEEAGIATEPTDENAEPAAEITDQTVTE